MIPTRGLATGSALLLATAGLALLFAADDVVRRLSGGAGPSLSVMGQLLGAAWLSLAWATWSTRTTPQGGIYGRPIVMANAGLYFVTALVCARGAGESSTIRVAAVLSAAMAVAYGTVMFGKSPGARG